eukprot:7717123-Alexandrium_andersonii.AAC.1
MLPTASPRTAGPCSRARATVSWPKVPNCSGSWARMASNLANSSERVSSSAAASASDSPSSA